MEKDIGRKALYFLSPLSEHVCCSPVKKNKNNKMKMKWHGSGELQDF